MCHLCRLVRLAIQTVANFLVGRRLARKPKLDNRVGQAVEVLSVGALLDTANSAHKRVTP